MGAGGVTRRKFSAGEWCFLVTMSFLGTAGVGIIVTIIFHEVGLLMWGALFASALLWCKTLE